MEEQLDVISSGKTIEWASICKTCYSEIKRLSGPIKNIKKQSYPIQDGYEYIFERYGPAIKHTLEDGTVEYLPAKKEPEIDLEKLKNNAYSLDELIEVRARCLGKYEGEDIYVKTGKYGVYLEWIKNTDGISETFRESAKAIKNQSTK